MTVAWAEYVYPLEQLIVNSAPDLVMGDQDYLEALDATWEDENGLLPHEKETE